MVTNSSVPESFLNKRRNTTCYHRVRESQDDGTSRAVWITGEYSLVDLLTKTTMTGNTRHRMVEFILYNKAVIIREKY